MPLSSVFYYW